MNQKSRITAVLLAFFLGGIGIHKFYLNNNKAGCFYLAFFWTFIPSLIALYDFIVLIMMSDQDFNAKYNTPVTPITNTPTPTNTVSTPTETPKL